MATIRSYTTVEQSKKLAEILPLESADMAYWKKSYRPNDYAIMAHHTKELQDGFEAKGMEYIPCWSLAALLNVLPEGTRLLKSATDDTYHCDCPKGNIDKWFDNTVDACVAMIESLHELKML